MPWASASHWAVTSPDGRRAGGDGGDLAALGLDDVDDVVVGVGWNFWDLADDADA